MSIPIKVGDRWAIVGASGSGKTVLARQVLKSYFWGTGGKVPIGIIDSKIVGDFAEFEKRKDLCQVITGNDPQKVVRMLWKKPFTIWRPEEDDLDMYDEYFRGVYLSARNKGTKSISFVDELSSITTDTGRAGKYWEIMNKQGRGMDNGMISLTQSPAYIPPSLMRQCVHLIRFQLNDEYDLKKMAKVMGPEAYEEPAHDYGFWYRNVLKPRKKSPAQYFSDMKEFMGR